MILDSSAVVALILGGPEAERLLSRLSATAEVAIGAPTLVEATIVLSHRLGPIAASLIERFLGELAVDVLPFEERHWRQAIEASRRFGKGFHPAALNFGDCMAYASARVAGRPLLSTGEDFAKTDLLLA
ncbi:MAG TPA: type II toxin-antitoxin system VapC family toxin [Thermoanaerobaculia bacterium]|nr:type II toxin-antitoxin system VapC family toxin [Thermoanaerobaculia bacterium]